MKIRCPHCGGRIAVDAEWCGICHERLVDPGEGPDPMAGMPEPKYAVDDDLPDHVAGRYSRWRKSSVTFGAFGRVVATLVVCVIPVGWFAFTFPPMAIVWIILLWPIALRSIWKKARVDPPKSESE